MIMLVKNSNALLKFGRHSVCLRKSSCKDLCSNNILQSGQLRIIFSQQHLLQSKTLFGCSLSETLQWHKKVMLPFQRFVRNFSTLNKKTSDVPSFHDRFIFPEPPALVSEDEHNTVTEKVNECIANPNRGRLFAVVHIAGKQYKVTDHDIIQTSGIIHGADIGDRIRLEKVLVVGGKDFTLVGRPILKRSLAKIEATIIEKTPGQEVITQYFQKRRSFERRYIVTPLFTILRINSVEAYPNLS